MTDPIDLDAYRPHEVSKMLCTRCGHKWTAVHPVGTTGLECPNCHEMEGCGMTDIVKGMAIAGWDAGLKVTGPGVLTADIEQAKMRAALMWLADNVSDEMVQAAWGREFGRGGFDGDIWRKTIKSAIEAAIRAAAGEEGK